MAEQTTVDMFCGTNYHAFLYGSVRCVCGQRRWVGYTAKSSERLPNPRKWLCEGGGGHEGGEAGLNAITVSGEGLVDFLEAYRDACLERLSHENH